MTAVDALLAAGLVLSFLVATAALVWACRTVAKKGAAPNAGVPDWIWTVNLEGEILHSNESCLEALGYTVKELVGQNAAIFMDPRELLRAETMVKATGMPEEGLSSLIISATHRDGSNTWFEVSIQPEVDWSGAMVGCRGVSRHIGPDAAQVVASRAMRSRIQHIIDNRLLVSAFQPIVDIRSDTVLGVEALSRMVDEPMTSPDNWFTEAATVGLGIDLELFALETALTAAVALPPDLYVSVNASPESCIDERLPAMIRASSIDPRRLVLEVTEHSQVLDYAPLTAALCRFRQSGIRIAVDDAGAGFASGQHLVKIRPDIIKLDRSIISAIDVHPDQRALAAGFVAFAAHIGAVLTAEGVETPEEARCVTAMGIQTGQGYLFGRATVDVREWQSWKTVGAQRTSQPVAAPDIPPAVHVTTGETSLGSAVLDALPDATAVVDGAGVIVAVNRAWRRFTEEGGGDPTATGVGANYLDVCSRAAAGGSVEAVEALRGLRAVLTGDAVVSESEYGCAGAGGPRWFVSRVNSLSGHETGAVVTHVDVTRRRMSEQKADHRPSLDPVAGLVDAELFHRVLTDSLDSDHAQSPEYEVGVVSVHLEGLPRINADFGHAAGAELLLGALERLTALIRPQDTVARIGGNRFAVCAPGIRRKALVLMADRMGATLGLPYPVHGRDLTVTAGIGSYLATTGADPAGALRAADRDLYAVGPQDAAAGAAAQ